MLSLFKKAGLPNSRNSKYQFWQQNNGPIEIFSNTFINQKLEYLHHNPVKAGIVKFAEDYTYNNAVDYAGKTGLIDIDLLF